MRLLQENVPYRKISRDLQISTRDISKIKKENKKIEEQNKKHFQVAQVFDYYEKGKDPFEVSEDFKMNLESAKLLYTEFLETKDFFTLAETLRKIDKESLQSLIELFELMNSKNLKSNQIDDIIKMVKDHSITTREYQSLLNELKIKQMEIKNNISANQRIIEKNSELKIENDEIQKYISRKKKELTRLYEHEKIKKKQVDIINDNIVDRQVSQNQIEMAFEKGDMENQIRKLLWEF